MRYFRLFLKFRTIAPLGKETNKPNTRIAILTKTRFPVSRRLRDEVLSVAVSFRGWLKKITDKLKVNRQETSFHTIPPYPGAQMGRSDKVLWVNPAMNNSPVQGEQHPRLLYTSEITRSSGRVSGLAVRMWVWPSNLTRPFIASSLAFSFKWENFFVEQFRVHSKAWLHMP